MEPPGIVHVVLGVAARELTHGRRSVDDTLQVLTQCRRFVKLEPQRADEIALLEMWYLARSGAAAQLEEIRSRVVALVTRFVELPQW